MSTGLVLGRFLSDLVQNRGAGGKFLGLHWPLLSVSICQEAFCCSFLTLQENKSHCSFRGLNHRFTCMQALSFEAYGVFLLCRNVSGPHDAAGGGSPLHQSWSAIQVRLWGWGAPCQRGREPQEWAERTGDVPDKHTRTRSTLSWGKGDWLCLLGLDRPRAGKCPVPWRCVVMISALGGARARGWARRRQRYSRVSAEHRCWSPCRALLLLDPVRRADARPRPRREADAQLLGS